MPWNTQGDNGGGPWSGGGNGGGGRGPWGQGPSGGGSGGGGGGQRPPNLEELLKRGQDRFKTGLPTGNWGKGGIALAVLVLLAVWLLSGFFTVAPQEQGVVLRFGEYVRTVPPGLNYHLPTPIENVLKPEVTRENQEEFGFRATRGTGSQADLARESLMLTGDENIVDINFVVVWRIGDARDYLFNIREPQATVRAVSESVTREVVGRSKIDDVLTEGREQVEAESKEIIQATLNTYGAGIEVIRVKLQKADPPAEVIDSFRDVQRARADQERLRNEAQAYANDIIPRARGEAEKLRQQAEGYREQVVADAQGQVARYLSILTEYQQAKDVIRERMYLETMEEIFQDMNKIIIDNKAGGSGVLPFLPLPELNNRAKGQQ